MRGEKELCMQIPVSYLIDLRYACRLLEHTLVSQEEQIFDVDPRTHQAQQLLRRMVDGYVETYELIDSL